MFSKSISSTVANIHPQPDAKDLEPGAGSSFDELQGLLSGTSRPAAPKKPTCTDFFRSLIPFCCRRLVIENDQQPGLSQP